MQKLLITGASGFLGKKVLEELILKNEYEIYAITTNSKKLSDFTTVKVVEFNLADISEIQQMMNKISPDVCVHLAWDQTSADFRMSHTNELFFKISMELLDSFKNCKGKKFFFAGSSSEYDGATGAFKETDDVKPHSLYGICKKKITEYGCSLNDHADGFQFISARFFTIFGLGDTHSFGAIPDLVRKLKNNEQVVCNSPYTTRDYIYVSDAAKNPLK
jgi:nucleoside-diphosphate-sugar epimerase